MSAINASLPDATSLFSFAVAVALAMAGSQSFISRNVGSDHPAHVFLTRRIRRNGYRLFVRIPDLLNDCFCGAIPMYIHWIIAHFSSRAVRLNERLLNPAVNTLHVVLFAGIAAFAFRHAGAPDQAAGVAACLFALTPQFYHVLSARNLGLGGRGTGLLLLTAFLFCAFAIESRQAAGAAWLGLSLAGWLIWGFSTFAQQALCIISVLLLILTGRWVPLAGTAVGLAVFIAVHPKFSLGYLRHTSAFIRAYARELAPIYILRRRPSIWRDLVWDIGRRFGSQGAAQAVRYAYENSVLIVVVLNPLAVLSCVGAAHGALGGRDIFAFSAAVAVCGAAAAMLTSFRPTRFLGEPERYIEAVTPWATLLGTRMVLDGGGPAAAALLVGIFLLLDLLQLGASAVLVRALSGRTPELDVVQRLIQARWGAGARLCSNNEHFTKMLMENDWQFSYCMAVGNPYCGMSIAEAFSNFPVLRPEACERIASAYRINACLLDRQTYDTLFELPPPGLARAQVAYESDRFRLLFLEWDGAAGDAAR